MPPIIAAPLALVIQIAVAIFLFGAIAVGAVVLNLATNFCESQKLAPEWIILGMRGLEVILWVGDAFCFLLLVVVEIWKFSVTVWKGRKV